MNRLLFISSNVLSMTKNNGKTLLSFIEGTSSLEVAQLYFSGEAPEVEGYSYFRMSDVDIIRGLTNSNRRGCRIEPSASQKSQMHIKSVCPRLYRRNALTLSLRDFIWHRHWESEQLLDWLDEFEPEALFFMAGDALFSYEICDFIRERFGARLTVYITDDYIMPRSGESPIYRRRRRLIKNAMRRTLENASCFYTISPEMSVTYESILGHKSRIIRNITDDMFVEAPTRPDGTLKMVYAGSLSNGREKTISKLANAILDFNKREGNGIAELVVYTNAYPTRDELRLICVQGASRYGGSLSREQLKRELNASDILVFVESFDYREAEKVRFSVSTKVPEYMSVGKAIIAIGPEDCSSMKLLADCAFCITDGEQLGEGVSKLLTNREERMRLGRLSRSQYLSSNNKERMQREFLAYVMAS